jgi:hypothetical protein
MNSARTPYRAVEDGALRHHQCGRGRLVWMPKLANITSSTRILPFQNAISYLPEDAIDHQSTSNKLAGGSKRRATCPVKECLPGFLGFGDTPTDRKLISLKWTRA